LVDIFTNDFEEGDFSAWTSTTGAPTIVHAPTHHNSHAMQASDTQNIYATISFGAHYNTFYCRFYARWSALAATATSQTRPLRLVRDTDAAVMVLRIASDEIATYATPAGWATTALAFNTAQWYCMDVKFVYHAANGEVRVYVDGTERVTRTGIDTTGAGNSVYKALLGLTSGGTTATTFNGDCFKAADAYIGPEVAGGTVKKGGGLVNSMMAMLNSKMLYSRKDFQLNLPSFSPRAAI